MTMRVVLIECCCGGSTLALLLRYLYGPAFLEPREPCARCATHDDRQVASRDKQDKIVTQNSRVRVDRPPERLRRHTVPVVTGDADGSTAISVTDTVQERTPNARARQDGQSNVNEKRSSRCQTETNAGSTNRTQNFVYNRNLKI